MKRANTAVRYPIVTRPTPFLHAIEKVPPECGGIMAHLLVAGQVAEEIGIEIGRGTIARYNAGDIASLAGGPTSSWLKCLLPTLHDGRGQAAMAQWTGKLYFFRDDHGYDHISLAMPTDSGKATVHVFQVVGPFIPIAMQKTVIVRDGDKWLADLLAQGFTFAPTVPD